MKLKEFRDATKDLNGELDLYLSSDEEGNSFSTLREINIVKVKAKKTNFGYEYDFDVAKTRKEENGILLWP